MTQSTTTLTPPECRALEARVEREIFGRCPHLNHGYNTITNEIKEADYICADCGKKFNAPAVPQYTRSIGNAWLIVEEMERQGFQFGIQGFEYAATGPDAYGKNGISLTTLYFAVFRQTGAPRQESESEDPKLAIIYAALQACEKDKGE